MTNKEAIRRMEFCRNFLANNYSDMGEPNVTAFNMAIKALEQQPCEDCISRQAVINKIANTCFWLSADNWEELIKCINSISPISTRPTGRWIDIQYFKADDTYYRPKCPFCSIEPKVYSNYCPNCGARMAESEVAE